MRSLLLPLHVCRALLIALAGLPGSPYAHSVWSRAVSLLAH